MFQVFRVRLTLGEGGMNSDRQLFIIDKAPAKDYLLRFFQGTPIDSASLHHRLVSPESASSLPMYIVLE